MDGEQCASAAQSQESQLQPLAVQSLFMVQPNGTVNYRQELGRLNRELLFCFLELADALVQRPQGYARTKDGLTALVHNMQFLLNSLRAHQARATLKHEFELQIREIWEATKKLRQQRRATGELLEHAVGEIDALRPD